MLYACVKDPFKEQDRPTDFNVKQEEKYTDGVSDSTWQIITKEAQLVKFGCNIKGKGPQSSEKALNITALIFNYKAVWCQVFSIYIDQNIAQQIEYNVCALLNQQLARPPAPPSPSLPPGHLTPVCWKGPLDPLFSTFHWRFAHPATVSSRYCHCCP